MTYVVTKAFTDSNLNSVDENGEKRVYWECDTYPYKQYAGATTKLRLKELLEWGYIDERRDEDVDQDPS